VLLKNVLGTSKQYFICENFNTSNGGALEGNN
jgi:hypothetical protein